MGGFKMRIRTILAGALTALLLACGTAAFGDVTNIVAFLKNSDTNLTVVVLDPPSWPNQRSLNPPERTVVRSNLLAALDRSLSSYPQPKQPLRTPPPPVAPSVCIDAYPYPPVGQNRYSEQDKALWRVSVYSDIGFYVEWWSGSDGIGKIFISGRQDADMLLKELRKLHRRIGK